MVWVSVGEQHAAERGVTSVQTRNRWQEYFLIWLNGKRQAQVKDQVLATRRLKFNTRATYFCGAAMNPCLHRRILRCLSCGCRGIRHVGRSPVTPTLMAELISPTVALIIAASAVAMTEETKSGRRRG